MASNVEGEALKRIASATKGGGISALTGWLAGRGNKGSGGSSSTAPKTGADYHNETLAKMYEHTLSERSKSGALRRTKNLMKASGQAVKGYGSGDERVDLYNAKSMAPKPTTRPRATASSSGGQGTSGNVRGTQFAGKPAAKPSRPNRIPSVESMTPSTDVSTAVDKAVSTPVKKPRAPRSPKA